MKAKGSSVQMRENSNSKKKDIGTDQIVESSALVQQVNEMEAHLLQAEQDAFIKIQSLTIEVHELTAQLVEKNAIVAAQETLTKQLSQSQAEINKLSQTLEQLTADHAKVQAELLRLQASAENEGQVFVKEKNEWLVEKDALETHLKSARIQLADLQKLNPSADKFERLIKEIEKRKVHLDKRNKEAKQIEAKLSDAIQENELLLLQLMQAQEESVEYFDKKRDFEELYEGYKARWDRLEKRLPNYVDYGAVELLAFDNVADIPTLTWRIKDYAQSSVAIPELQFITVLHDGHPGIGLVKPGLEPVYFVPRLLTTAPEFLRNFMGLTTSEIKKISAVVPIFEQIEASQWEGFEFPAHFDASFWRPSLKTLMTQIKALPPVLRYEEVVLKRELINPDYEHLWMEFKGLSIGARNWRKFEIRLGAALVQAGGFSQYPKFEFPLIDGKNKPFESWYAESHDDSGAKLELRFALDKQALDTAVLTKLSEADRGLVLRLVNILPDALLRLEAEKTAIHRPWRTWIDFAQNAADLLKNSRATPKKTPESNRDSAPSSGVTPVIPALVVPTPVAPTPVATVLVNKPSPLRDGKVLSFNSKPMNNMPKITAAHKKTAHKQMTKKA
jgi:hypothetical protein